MGLSKEEFIQGQIEKKDYRKKWLTKVKKIKSHPINHGIHMDTHHLISAEAITISELGDSLINKGYVIDSINNLVGFPSTLPGACHLGVQLHRGDHHHKLPGEEPYHDFVSGLIKRKADDIKSCYGRTTKKETSSEIHNLLDPISDKILKRINKFTVPLTEIFDDYQGNCNRGCRNSNDIVPARDKNENCSLNRNHYGETDLKYQNSEMHWNKKTITYKSHWTPEVGK